MRLVSLFLAVTLLISVGTGAIAQEAPPAGETPAEPLPSLVIGPGDVRIEQTIEGGYYLYVRRAAGINSILITESTEAPDHGVATYAFRNPGYHSENGDELRMLDGEFLDTSSGLYSLIDSTTTEDELLGEAFRVFIPYVIVYGYAWTRNGEVQVLDGSYLSIRAFANQYADYSGGYRDNPFVMRVTQRPSPPETRELMPAAVETFTEIAEEAGGETVAPEDEGLVETIDRLIAESTGRSLDLVLALDTTESMEDNIPELQHDLVPMLEAYIGKRERLRVGLVYYRDYMEEYLTRRVDFQDDLAIVQRAIDTVRVAGGRDIPEAVYEALHTALVGFSWEADDRMIVLVGDAPPHPRPRSWITQEVVQRAAEERGVEIHTIILPQ
jgi:Mg-chelatase subunit ChlD